MIAVVTEYKDKRNARKLTTELLGDIALVRVGKRVGAFRLKMALMSFGGDIVFAPGMNTRGISSINTEPYKEELLFKMFVSYCLSQPGLNLKVGIVDIEGKYAERLVAVIGRVSSTLIYSEQDMDGFCRYCITETGTCPDIVPSRSHLYECDIVFSPGGLRGFSGILFGKGGTEFPKSKIMLPDYCNKALECGADSVDIAAAIAHTAHAL